MACEEALKCRERPILGVKGRGGGALAEATRRGERKKAKGRETKMTGGIQMHLSSSVNPLACLLSFHLGHWTPKERGVLCWTCVCVCVCVCLQAFRGYFVHALVSAWLAEGRGHLQMCAHWRDGECLPLKAWVCVLAQRVTQACAHTVAFFHRAVVWPAVSVWKMFSRLWGPLCWSYSARMSPRFKCHLCKTGSHLISLKIISSFAPFWHFVFLSSALDKGCPPDTLVPLKPLATFIFINLFPVAEVIVKD